ncbi:MAG: site-2 protease family protein [Candidatus Berkelbacteria bacterium]|nr:site-2 protease family protein [Candidatus Berkelbacteria bacterium]
MLVLTILAFVIVLSLLVFVHEFGHFVMARLSKIKVEEFAFGFPPRLISMKRGETRYSINLIPFGGYVKMLGEDKSNPSPDSFSQKKPRVRFSVIVAGVVMNIVLAGVLFSAGYMMGMAPVRLDPNALGGQKSFEVVVAEVVGGSPAASAGLERGDSILGFASSEEFSKFTHSNLGREVYFSVKKDGRVQEMTVKLSDSESTPFGVGVVSLPIVKLPFFSAVYAGFKEMLYTTGYIFVMLKDLIVNLFKEHKVTEQVAGPVGIFNLTGQAVKMGIVYLIQLAAILSINLGLINILPFPALDGGRAVVVLAEGIFRRRVVKEEIENFFHTLGFVLLMALIVLITFKELRALF